MTIVARLRWAVLAALCRAAQFWVLAFAPSPQVRHWLERGLEIAAQGEVRERLTGRRIVSVEIRFNEEDGGVRGEGKT